MFVYKLSCIQYDQIEVCQTGIFLRDYEIINTVHYVGHGGFEPLLK